MTEIPQPYQVPNPEEIDSLLLGDFGVDEAPPENHPGAKIPPGAKVMEVGDRESSIDADRDMGYRKSVRAMHEEYTRQFNEIEKLIVNLYLDLQYISRIGRNAWQLIADNEADKARFLLDMIDSQAFASIRSIECNSQTSHLPQSLIHSHERTTTNRD